MYGYIVNDKKIKKINLSFLVSHCSHTGKCAGNRLEDEMAELLSEKQMTCSDIKQVEMGCLLSRQI